MINLQIHQKSRKITKCHEKLCSRKITKNHEVISPMNEKSPNVMKSYHVHARSPKIMKLFHLITINHDSKIPIERGLRAKSAVIHGYLINHKRVHYSNKSQLEPTDGIHGLMGPDLIPDNNWLTVGATRQGSQRPGKSWKTWKIKHFPDLEKS